MAIGIGEGIAIAKILATLGQGYFASRDADRMRREQEKAQAEQDRRVGVANIRNAFGGRAVPSPVNYTPSGPGMGSQLLGALGTAADVAGIYHGATKADDLRKLQMENVQGQIDARTLATDTAKQELARAERQRSVDFGKRMGTELGKQALTTAIPATETSLFTDRPPRQVTTTLGETAPTDVLLGASQGMRARELSDAQLRKTLAEAGRLEAQGRSYDATGALERVRESVALATPVVTNAAASGATWQELTSSPVMGDVDIRSSEILKSIFENTKRTRLESQNKGLSDFLYSDLKSKFSADQLLKKSGDLIFGMNLMANGWNQQNGAGDLMMTNAMVRLSDPGVSVRPIEAEQMEAVGGKLEEWKVILKGEKFMEGNKFTPEVRRRLLDAAEALYGGSINQINDKLMREVAAATPRVLDLTGRSDPGQVPMFADFVDTYRLSDLSTYNINYDADTLARAGLLRGGGGPAESFTGGTTASPTGTDWNSFNTNLQKYNPSRLGKIGRGSGGSATNYSIFPRISP